MNIWLRVAWVCDLDKFDFLPQFLNYTLNTFRLKAPE